jgi:hypothetical protein
MNAYWKWKALAERYARYRHEARMAMREWLMI